LHSVSYPKKVSLNGAVDIRVNGGVDTQENKNGGGYPMKERTIRFSEMFDKLKPENRKIGQRFTTFRAYTVYKDKYYTENKGNEFIIKLDDKKLGKVLLLDIGHNWSNTLGIEHIRSDTYQHWEYRDWNNLMAKFYHYHPIYLIKLWLEWLEPLIEGE